MKYFWPILISIVVLTGIVFLFFVFSVRVKDKVKYTDAMEITEPEVTIADPSRGPVDAPVTIINYGDYECAACARLETTLSELEAEYGDSLRIVWKDMPNTSQHRNALSAAVAARCAGEQKKFWEYHEILMTNQNMLGTELYLSAAQETGLRERAFVRCVDNESTLPLVQRTYDEGVALDITATPTLFINGERYTGGVTTSELRRLIDSLINSL